MKKYKILVAGASTYGVGNMGDDAMLLNLTQEFHKNIDCEITFLARHPDTDYDDIFNIDSIKNYEFNKREDSIGKYFFGFNKGDDRQHLTQIYQAIIDADLVVIGGNSFMEIFPNQFMRGVTFYSALIAIFSVFFQKPYVLYGVAGHRIDQDLTKSMAKFLCFNAECVTVREDFYRQVLLEADVDISNVHVMADPAFGVDPVSADLGKEILIKENIIFTRPRVFGISFRHMYWKWDDVTYDQYLIKIAAICDYIVENFNAEVLFVPNCVYESANKYQDDRLVASHIYLKMTNQAFAHVIITKVNLKQTLSLYYFVDLLVSNRRHASIFAAINNKPFMAMSSGHSWQFLPFMNSLGIEKFAISFTDNTYEELTLMLNNLWENRKEFLTIMNERIVALRIQARKQVSMFCEIIRKK